ncbi:MAG: hypothetical protein AB7U82_15405 [Blastocatellales bacterium]
MNLIEGFFRDTFGSATAGLTLVSILTSLAALLEALSRAFSEALSETNANDVDDVDGLLPDDVDGVDGFGD